MATVKKNAGSAASQTSADEQAKIDILTGIVDKDTRTYTMQKTISIGGEKKDGTFRFRYPTIADRLRQGVLQSRFLGGVAPESLDLMTYNIAFEMGFLASVSDQLPAWFKFEDMESLEELQEIYLEVNAFVDSFRRENDADTDAAGGEVTAGKKTLANG